MRNELCLDNRNEPKWSVVLQAADRVNACAVVYAAMLVQDVQAHGRETDAWPMQRDVLPRVAEFLALERQLVRDGQTRDLWRIAHLDSRIRLVKDAYCWGRQDVYVQTVLTEVKRSRENQQRVVVLLDPCTGIAARKGPGHAHFRISPDAVAALWRGLCPGDVLLVFQWADRARGEPARYRRPRELLQQSLGMPTNQDLAAPPLARCFSDGRYGFFAMIELPR